MTTVPRHHRLIWNHPIRGIFFLNNLKLSYKSCFKKLIFNENRRKLKQLTFFDNIDKINRSLANKKRDRRLETQPQTQTTCTVETQTDHDHPVNLAVLRLETDVRRLKSDLQLARNLESDLQSQLKNVHTAEKSMRSEISNLQRIRDDYSSRLNSANSAKQSLQHDLSVVEKKLVDEKKARANVEQQLNSVRMARKQDEQQRQKELAQHQQLQIQHQQQLQLQQQQQSKGECTEQCRKRRFQLDNEIKELQLKLKRSDER